ncbi:MAG: hypothetical protein MSH66_07485 [Bacteroidales bacterium]|nr:hypothetical protein [Bacteroidales bacterium]
MFFIFSKIFFALCAFRKNFLAANKRFNAANSALIRQTSPSAVFRIKKSPALQRKSGNIAKNSLQDGLCF